MSLEGSYTIKDSIRIASAVFIVLKDRGSQKNIAEGRKQRRDVVRRDDRWHPKVSLISIAGGLCKKPKDSENSRASKGKF